MALDHLNLKIPKGEFLAITGKSGCGKSTLINILGGLDIPDQGQVMIDGEDLSQMDDRRLTLFRRDRIGIIFQFFNLLPILSLEENIVLPHLLKKAQIPSRPDWIGFCRRWTFMKEEIINPMNFQAERCNEQPSAVP